MTPKVNLLFIAILLTLKTQVEAQGSAAQTTTTQAPASTQTQQAPASTQTQQAPASTQTQASSTPSNVSGASSTGTNSSGKITPPTGPGPNGATAPGQQKQLGCNVTSQACATGATCVAKTGLCQCATGQFGLRCDKTQQQQDQNQAASKKAIASASSAIPDPKQKLSASSIQTIISQLSTIDCTTLTADMQQSVAQGIQNLLLNPQNALQLTLAQSQALQVQLSTLNAQLLASNPGGGQPLGKDQLKQVAKQAKEAQQQIKLANVFAACGSNSCDGSANLNAGNSAITKTQAVKKAAIVVGTPIAVTTGNAAVSFPIPANSGLSGNAFVSQTIHTDADNPLNVIDPNSIGVMDIDVYSDGGSGGFAQANITNYGANITITLPVVGAPGYSLAFYNETSQQMQFQAACNDPNSYCTANTNHLTTFSLTNSVSQGQSSIYFVTFSLLSILGLMI